MDLVVKTSFWISNVTVHQMMASMGNTVKVSLVVTS